MNEKLLRTAERVAAKTYGGKWVAAEMPPEARKAIEGAFLRVMSNRHPEYGWEAGLVRPG